MYKISLKMLVLNKNYKGENIAFLMMNIMMFVNGQRVTNLFIKKRVFCGN